MTPPRCELCDAPVSVYVWEANGGLCHGCVVGFRAAARLLA